MELWGAALFGDPCRQCGFDWTLSPVAAVALVGSMHTGFDEVVAGADGSERSAGWSVSEYVSHVADNLRQWCERLQGARLAGVVDVVGYDPDELARVRGYAETPLATALWSLGLSAVAWSEVVTDALEEGVELRHATRGDLRAADVARNNAHDAFHHLWDVRQILGQ